MSYPSPSHVPTFSGQPGDVRQAVDRTAAGMFQISGGQDGRAGGGETVPVELGAESAEPLLTPGQRTLAHCCDVTRRRR